MLPAHSFRTIGPAARGALAIQELVGLDGRGCHPTGCRMLAVDVDSVESKVGEFRTSEFKDQRLG
jgi:hypothetical protein